VGFRKERKEADLSKGYLRPADVWWEGSETGGEGRGRLLQVKKIFIKGKRVGKDADCWVSKKRSTVGVITGEGKESITTQAAPRTPSKKNNNLNRRGLNCGI